MVPADYLAFADRTGTLSCTRLWELALVQIERLVDGVTDLVPDTEFSTSHAVFFAGAPQAIGHRPNATFIVKSLPAWTTSLYTDGWRQYCRLYQEGYNREPVLHIHYT